MANSNAVSSTLPSSYHCKICELSLDTVESLEVHLQYHKENLYVKWGSGGGAGAGAGGQHDADNNNGAKLKSESTVSAPADSSDAMITKPSAEFQRATPETSSFPHPATPQSYHSAPSPYQNPDQTTFSPGPQFPGQFPHGFPPAHDQLWEQQQYPDYHKPGRFHPYAERAQVSSSSPLYPPPLSQPTPSPSPNQCDKCGFVCDSALQLSEHCSSAHAQHFQQFPPKNYSSPFNNDAPKIKEEHEESSDILDLDSQKVVYQGNEGEQPSAPYDQPQPQTREVNSRTVPMMPWEAQKLYSNPQMNGDVSLFKDQKLFSEQKNFHSEQKFAYGNEKFLSVHHDQKPFMHGDQKLYPVQMPPLSEYAGSASAADMKPPYRPYDSPTAPQITSTQPANSTSTALPPIGGKGANWKSNEARRPKTYNCTACNKWFTSSGHLKRHYNTTLHKNAVRSSGQPDPASMPISSHHHPAREALSRAPPPDSNTQSPAPPDDARDDAPPYAAQTFDRSHRAAAAAAMHAKSPYSHLQQGNIDNNFMSNNPLANHPLPHQVGSHPLNIGSQPPGLDNLNNSNQSSKGAAISSSGNPPNGEAGPSVTQNHHLRGLLSVSTSNITSPALAQSTPMLAAHTLPPFSHLAANPYSPRSTEPLAPSHTDHTHTPLYLGQNFQQTIAQNYPNGMAPHVMDMAISNLHIANPATFGESMPEEVLMECETSSDSSSSRLPSFSQLQAQRFGVYVPNYLPSPNVGGPSEELAQGYIIIDPASAPMQYNPDLQQKIDYEYEFAPKQIKEDDTDMIKMYRDGGVVACYSSEELPRADSSAYKILKIENIMDYANKENYESEMQSPASPESAKETKEGYEGGARYEGGAGGSPSISSTVPAPLAESNHIAAAAALLHKCFECDKMFSKACYLTQHNKTFHSGAKPFKCDRCGKRFSDDATYEEHFSKHAENKPFKCLQCPKSFNHKTDLRRHMCLHSGTKPFACHHCGKGFIRKDHMLKHCETHRKKNVRPAAT